jgi:uncharacterized membrane protein YfcA
VVGLLVGFTGVGGGSLMTPLLVLLFGVHPATAVGTDLLYASITKSAGAVMHGFNKTVDWRVTGLLALGSVPAALVTLAVLAWVGHSRDTARLISIALGYALLATALSFLLRHKILEIAARRRKEPRSARWTATMTMMTGAALGAIVTISSVGAGALGITALLMLYPLLPVARIVGSDIAHAVPLTLAAGLGHWALGAVDWALLGSLLIGSIPGILIGSHFAPKVSDTLLRSLLAGVLTVVGAKLAFG